MRRQLHGLRAAIQPPLSDYDVPAACEQDDVPESIRAADGADVPYIPCHEDDVPEHCATIHGAKQPARVTTPTRPFSPPRDGLGHNFAHVACPRLSNM